MAVDFGNNKVGVALWDSLSNVILPKVIIRNFGSLKSLADKLNDICLSDDIKLIVFGLPLGPGGDETMQSKRLRSIAFKIKNLMRMDVSFDFQDESFSSYESSRVINAMPKGVVDNGDDDAVAAMMLLEIYLKNKEGF